jgi:Arsenical pump membrane protein
MFACVYAANTASLFLPISNLTNLLAYNAFELGFAQYALIMLAPAALTVLTNLLLFGWLFRRDLRGSYDPMAMQEVLFPYLDALWRPVLADAYPKAPTTSGQSESGFRMCRQTPPS